MDIKVVLGKGKKVDALFGGHLIKTDQPIKTGGDNSSPTPFALFLASIGTCVGYYIKSFCDERELNSENIKIYQNMEFDPITKTVSRIELNVVVPPDFPNKYYNALIRAAGQCTVKKHLSSDIIIDINVGAN